MSATFFAESRYLSRAHPPARLLHCAATNEPATCSSSTTPHPELTGVPSNIPSLLKPSTSVHLALSPEAQLLPFRAWTSALATRREATSVQRVRILADTTASWHASIPLHHHIGCRRLVLACTSRHGKHRMRACPPPSRLSSRNPSNRSSSTATGGTARRATLTHPRSRPAQSREIISTFRIRPLLALCQHPAPVLSESAWRSCLASWRRLFLLLSASFVRGSGADD